MTGTQVSWSYDEASAKLTATYTFTTTAKQGNGTGTVFALYPHQRDQLAGTNLSSYSYVSPRGPMRVAIGASKFTTVTPFNGGVLPQLANTGFTSGADVAQLNGYVDEVASKDPFAGFGEDTYWTGKAIGRATQVAQIANLTGNTGARDALLSKVKARLTDWMTASPGETQRLFAYDQKWGHAHRLPPRLVRLGHRPQRPPLPLRLLRGGGPRPSRSSTRRGPRPPRTAAWSTPSSRTPRTGTAATRASRSCATSTSTPATTGPPGTARSVRATTRSRRRRV